MAELSDSHEFSMFSPEANRFSEPISASSSATSHTPSTSAHSQPEYAVQVTHDSTQPSVYDSTSADFSPTEEYDASQADFASGYDISGMAPAPALGAFVPAAFNTNQMVYPGMPGYTYDPEMQMECPGYVFDWMYPCMAYPVTYDAYMQPLESEGCTPDAEPALEVEQGMESALPNEVKNTDNGRSYTVGYRMDVDGFPNTFGADANELCEDATCVAIGEVPSSTGEAIREGKDDVDTDASQMKRLLNPEAAEWIPGGSESVTTDCTWSNQPLYYCVRSYPSSSFGCPDWTGDEDSRDWNTDSTEWHPQSQQFPGGMFPANFELDEGMPPTSEEETAYDANGSNWWTPPIPEAEEWASQEDGVSTDWGAKKWTPTPARSGMSDEWFAANVGDNWEETVKDEIASSSRSEFSCGKDLGKEINKSGEVIMSLQHAESMQALNLEMPAKKTAWLQERRNRVERDQSKLRRRSFMKEISGESTPDGSDSEATPTTSAGSDLHMRKSFPEAESCVGAEDSLKYSRDLLLQLRLPSGQNDACVRLRTMSQHKKKAEKRKRREREYRYWERDDRYWERQTSSYSVSSWQSLSVPPKQPTLKRWKSGGHLEELKRNCQSLLNKICPENLTTIVSQLATLEIADATDIELVISLIFKKALLEPHYSQTYSDMVFSLQNKFPHFPNPDKSRSNDEVVSFTRVLVHTCQREFELLRSEDFAALDDDQHMLRKRRCLAHMKLLGSLYLRTLLSHKVIKLVCEDLLCGSPPEHFIESAIALLQSLGYAFEKEKGPEFADTIIKKLNELLATGAYGKRIQFMVKDLLDLRANGWQQKTFEAKAGVAKTLKEVANSWNEKYSVAGARPEYILNEDSFADQLLLQMKEEKNLSTLFQKTFSDLPDVRQEKICVIMTQKGLFDIAEPRRRAHTECDSKIRLCEGAIKQLNLNPEVLKSVSMQTRKAAADYSSFPAVSAFCDRIDKMSIQA